MPIATLKFKLPEEQHEFDLAIRSGSAKSMLWDFSNQLRGWYKHHHDFKDSNDAVTKIREEFYRLLNEYRVDLD